MLKTHRAGSKDSKAHVGGGPDPHGCAVVCARACMPDLEARFRAVVEAAYELDLHKLEVVADKKGGKTTQTPLQVDVSAYAYDGIMLGLAQALNDGWVEARPAAC